MTRKLGRPETVNKTLLSDLAETFLKQGKYLRNWSDRTVRTYRQGLVCLGDSPLTKTGLETWVVSMRERGLTPGGCNMYIRTVKAFMGCLVEEGHLPSRLKLKLLKGSSPSQSTRKTD
jgi:hypothetical protein